MNIRGKVIERRASSSFLSSRSTKMPRQDHRHVGGISLAEAIVAQRLSEFVQSGSSPSVEATNPFDATTEARRRTPVGAG